MPETVITEQEIVNITIYEAGVTLAAGTWLSGVGSPAGSLGVDGNFYYDTVGTTIYGPKTAGAWGAGKAVGVGATGKSVLSGTGVPSSGTGTNGEFYIDKDTWDIYGPKESGAWPAAVSLVGPQGAQGAQGIQGEQGEQGIQGETGPSGLEGTRVRFLDWVMFWKGDGNDGAGIEIDDLVDGYDVDNGMRKVNGIVKALPWNTYNAGDDSYPNLKTYINTSHGA